MPGLLQFRIACLPGGSVRRKQPQLMYSLVCYTVRDARSRGVKIQP